MNDAAELIADLVGGGGQPPGKLPPEATADDPGPLPEIPNDPDPIDRDIVAACASLDQSDTDNGARLIKHFGVDLSVMETEGGRSESWVVWVGTHWDAFSGADAALRVAQKIGRRIIAEADFMSPGPREVEAIDMAAGLSKHDPSKLTKLERGILADAEDAREKLSGRKTSRRKFGVTSKNVARLNALLACAAPHLTRKPDAYNPDPLVCACATHTLRFVEAPDPECPDPDVERPVWTIVATPGHARDDWITRLAPVAYNPAARCPRWDEFLTRFLPDPDARAMVQTFSGLGLTGLPVQKLLFHYGNGANGKSVFLEVLSRLLGPLAVNLPAESIAGDDKRGGQAASPDLARLHGARFVRVAELPQGEPLKEELVKRLTGGEAIAVRNLFKGFFDFQPVFKAHMSGNGYPRIDGTDNGIWRRMAVVKWPVTLAEVEQKNFEDVVASFVPEFSGIFNWLLDGALDYLKNGLVTPETVRDETAEYRDAMDPVGRFFTMCVEYPCERAPEAPEKPLYFITAREMFEAYKRFCLGNALSPYHETRFGRVMKQRIPRDNGRVRKYLDCRLKGMDELPDLPKTRSPDGDAR